MSELNDYEEAEREGVANADERPALDPVFDAPELPAFTDVQSARADALWQARGLLLGEGGGAAGPFARFTTAETPIGSSDDFASDLISVAKFILDGVDDYAEVEAVAPGVLVVPDSLAPHVRFKDSAIVIRDERDPHDCACNIAAQFTGGERDLPEGDPTDYYNTPKEG